MTVEEYKQEYTTLGIALAGCYATAPGYTKDSTCSITIYDKRLNAYLGNLVEGGTVIDKRTCAESDVIQYVFNGPMLKETLPSGTVDRMWEKGPMPYDGSEYRSSDFIALDLYISFWKNLGARIGKRIGDSIHWNDGEIQAIPSAEMRWQQTR